MSTAVLLVNLGTPEAPTAPALRRYLKQFLSDPRVVEIPRPIWWLILNGIILNVRPKKSARKYAQIWTPDGSPLKVHTEKQAKLLRGALGHAGHPDIAVAWAMRYGEPAVANMLDKLQAEGAKRILVLPLYPQYAASTTASTFDAVAAWLKTRRNLPELQLVRDYHDHPGYIGALAQSVLDHWMAHGRPDDSYRLMMSFHGLPKRCTDLGDPYQSECLATGRLLAQALGLTEQQYAITFQSRFGAAEWLQPYTQPTLEDYARAGVKRVDVICPGFAGDCLETLEEIGLECRDAYLQAGGGEFRYIPCLNERADWIAALTQMVLHRLGR
jgi:ferrochelatase